MGDVSTLEIRAFLKNFLQNLGGRKFIEKTSVPQKKKSRYMLWGGRRVQFDVVQSDDEILSNIFSFSLSQLTWKILKMTYFPTSGTAATESCKTLVTHRLKSLYCFFTFMAKCLKNHRNWNHENNHSQFTKNRKNVKPHLAYPPYSHITFPDKTKTHYSVSFQILNN